MSKTKRAESKTTETRRSPRSVERVGDLLVDMQERSASCLQCREKFELRTVFGRQVPEACPTCHPPAREVIPLRSPAPATPAAPTPERPKVDVLGALNDGGVNMFKYRDATLESFDASEDPHTLEAARDFVEVWRRTFGERFAYRPWIYLFGDGSEVKQVGSRKEAVPGRTGNGKTHFAVAIARALIEQGLLLPDRFQFVEMEEILMKSEATIRGSDDSEDRLVGRYAGPELLIIDDCFVRPPTNHSMRLFMRILNRRAGRGLILTSNLSLHTAKQLDAGMARIVDRVMDECGDGGRFFVKFSGRSRRADRVLRGREAVR